jgi:P-type Cu+ transporter
MNLGQKQTTTCFHCGQNCGATPIVALGHQFCCQGCMMVYNVLQANNLCTYYDLSAHPGRPLPNPSNLDKWDFLAEKTIENELLAFKSSKLNTVQLNIPAAHCSSCIWLLQHFYKLLPGVLQSNFSFVDKQLTISYHPKQTNLKEIAITLESIGYAAAIHLGSQAKKPTVPQQKSISMQLAVAGFCMGNIMLLSIPEYLGINLEPSSQQLFTMAFRYYNVLLSLVLIGIAAKDYWLAAYRSAKELWLGHSPFLSVEVPIAIGLLALWGRSLYEVFARVGSGYFDSLAGLVLLLLIGKWLQNRSYQKLSFSHKYQQYFPLAVAKQNGNTLIYSHVAALKKGDIINIKHGGIIPTDGNILENENFVDYSFVTGETKPVPAVANEQVFAGGRVLGQAMNILVAKACSQSYLTQLWNLATFKEEKSAQQSKIALQFGHYFTYVTLGLAFFTLAYWYVVAPGQMWFRAIAVLMVACPCALTLSLPFTMHLLMGIFAKNNFFFKNQNYLNLLQQADILVFDKTGTLTTQQPQVRYEGNNLSTIQLQQIILVTTQSSHPYSMAIAEFLQKESGGLEASMPIISEYYEFAGQGIEAWLGRTRIRIGKSSFMQKPGSYAPNCQVAIEYNGHAMGSFFIQNGLREGWQQSLVALKNRGLSLHLLSGDNNSEAEVFKPYFDRLSFNQNPNQKHQYIQDLKAQGHTVVMLGDGLNDAAALQAATIGIAVSEAQAQFSPASDAILHAAALTQLPQFMALTSTAFIMIKWSFVLSLLYNIVGLSLAVSGQLSPLFAAIFMPLSSISVLGFAVLGTKLITYIKHPNICL